MMSSQELGSMEKFGVFMVSVNLYLCAFCVEFEKVLLAQPRCYKSRFSMISLQHFDALLSSGPPLTRLALEQTHTDTHTHTHTQMQNYAISDPVSGLRINQTD